MDVEYHQHPNKASSDDSEWQGGNGEWTTVTNRRNKNKLKKLVKSEINFYNAYSSLAVEDDNVDNDHNQIPQQNNEEKPVPQNNKKQENKDNTRHQRKAARRRHVKHELRKLKEQENLFLDHSITMAEDTRTENAKNDRTNKKRVSIDAAHTATAATQPSLLQQGRNLSYKMGTTFWKAIQHLQYANQHVQFKTNNKITTFF